MQHPQTGVTRCPPIRLTTGLSVVLVSLARVGAMTGLVVVSGMSGARTGRTRGGVVVLPGTGTVPAGVTGTVRAGGAGLDGATTAVAVFERMKESGRLLSVTARGGAIVAPGHVRRAGVLTTGVPTASVRMTGGTATSVRRGAGTIVRVGRVGTTSAAAAGAGGRTGRVVAADVTTGTVVVSGAGGTMTGTGSPGVRREMTVATTAGTNGSR